MPMLRVRSIAYCRLAELAELDFGALTVLPFSATASICHFLSENENAPKVACHRGALGNLLLPAEMRKCLVGLRHLMDLVALSDRIALALVSFEDFSR